MQGGVVVVVLVVSVCVVKVELDRVLLVCVCVDDVAVGRVDVDVVCVDAVDDVDVKLVGVVMDDKLVGVEVVEDTGVVVSVPLVVDEVMDDIVVLDDEVVWQLDCTGAHLLQHTPPCICGAL